MEYTPVGLFHLITGIVVVLTGFAAIYFPKGSTPHRLTGTVFLLCMTGVALSGFYMSIARSIVPTMFLSLIAFHAVTTGWITITRAEGTIGAFEKVMLNVVAISALICTGFGIYAGTTEAGSIATVPPAGFYGFAATLGFLAILDYRVVRLGGLFGKQRIARHLWRMCFSLFIGTTIFFLGNNHVLPPFFRQAVFLYAPILLVAVLTFVWLFIVLFTRWFEKRAHES